MNVIVLFISLYHCGAFLEKKVYKYFRIFRNPPKGDRRGDVLFCEIGDSHGFSRLYFDHLTSITDGK